jgi:hypothetical protein
MNLHAKIMNLTCDTQRMTSVERMAYKLGHRDARHAAGELANEADVLIAELLVALETANSCMKVQRDFVDRGRYSAAWDAPISMSDAAIASAKNEQS